MPWGWRLGPNGERSGATRERTRLGNALRSTRLGTGADRRWARPSRCGDDGAVTSRCAQGESGGTVSARGVARAGDTMDRVQALVVQVAAIHHVEGPSFDGQEIQHIHFVQRAIADVNARGDRTAQVEPRVQLDGPFGGAKRSPGNRLKHRSMVVASSA